MATPNEIMGNSKSPNIASEFNTLNAGTNINPESNSGRIADNLDVQPSYIDKTAKVSLSIILIF